MARLNPNVDIVLDILKAVQEARPADAFVQSILHQYIERGGLSKKQLLGLHGKALKISGIAPAKLATLEAIIKKKALKDRTAAPPTTPLFEKDAATGALLEKILEKFPQHKQALVLKAKYENDQPLSATEKSDLERFARLADKK